MTTSTEFEDDDDGTGFVFESGDSAGCELGGSTVTVAINEFEEIQNGDRSRFTQYNISVSSGDQGWVVKRRYKEFRAMHVALCGVLGAKRLPKLPPRKLIGAHSVPFVEERQRSLQAYLVALVATPGVVDQPVFVQFLLPGSASATPLASRRSSSQSVADKRSGDDALVALREGLSAARMASTDSTSSSIRARSTDKSDAGGGVHDAALLQSLDDSSGSASSAVSGGGALAMTVGKKVNQVQVSGSAIGAATAAVASDDGPSLYRSPSTLSVNSYDSLPVSAVGSPATHVDWAAQGMGIAGVLSEAPAGVAHHRNDSRGGDRLLWPPVSPSQHTASRQTGHAATFGLSFMLASPPSAAAHASPRGQQTDGSTLEGLSGWTAGDVHTGSGLWSTGPQSLGLSFLSMPQAGGLVTPVTFESSAPPQSPPDVSSPSLQACESRMDDILLALTPKREDASTNAMKTACAFMKRLLKSALGAQVYPVGRFACQLHTPHDTLHLSVFLPLCQTKTCFLKVSEALFAASLGDDSSDSESGGSIVSEHRGTTQSSVGDAIPSPDGAPVPMCHIDSITVTKGRRGHDRSKLSCVVEGVNMEMTFNRTEELGIVTLIEAADVQIGKRHLFKRSLHLILAWFRYESVLYGGKPDLLDVIPWRAFVTLVLWVFIRRRTVVTQPLLALHCFLSDFAAFDWERYCVSLHGAIALSDVGSGVDVSLSRDALHPTVPALGYPVVSRVPSQEVNAVVSEDVINACISRTNSRAKAASGDADDASMGAMTMGTSMALPSGMSATMGVGATSTPSAVKQRSFKIRVMNVMDPTDAAINTASVVGLPEFELLKAVIVKGAQAVQTMMDSMRAVSPLECNTVVNDCMPGITKAAALALRGSSGMAAASRSHSREFDDLCGDINTCLLNIQYCAFLVDSEVTAPALCALATDILMERGELPVGEIGKLLQEVASSASLSTLLKEKFGGLKKFLEMHSEVFVMGKDHPFNPHVYLRSTLSDDALRQVLSGGPPVVVSPVAAARKKKASRRKKSGGTSAMLDDGASDMGMGGGVGMRPMPSQSGTPNPFRYSAPAMPPLPPSRGGTQSGPPGVYTSTPPPPPLPASHDDSYARSPAMYREQRSGSGGGGMSSPPSSYGRRPSVDWTGGGHAHGGMYAGSDAFEPPRRYSGPPAAHHSSGGYAPPPSSTLWERPQHAYMPDARIGGAALPSPTSAASPAYGTSPSGHPYMYGGGGGNGGIGGGGPVARHAAEASGYPARSLWHHMSQQ